MFHYIIMAFGFGCTASSQSETLLEYSHHLHYIYKNGIFPEILKVANVTPLYKKDDLKIFSNYRPVSVLSALSKILEKVIYDRLNDFLNEFEIIFKYLLCKATDTITYSPFNPN